MSLRVALSRTRRRVDSRQAGRVLHWLLTTLLTLIVTTAMAAELPPPADLEDLGAYSPTALEAARARLKSTLVTAFAGGRHGFVGGERVPLDPDDWRTEATVTKGKVMVPERFALSAFGLKRMPWFGFGITQKKGMVALADLADKMKKEVFIDERGLVIVTDEPLTLSDSQLIDSIIVLFDTPEKFADPQIAYRNLPSIKAWGKLVNQVKVTDKQVERFEGSETSWRLMPQKAYDYTGLRLQELASPLPDPGVHPRILFSPDDVPTLSSRIRSSVAGAKSLMALDFLLRRSFLDPNSSDGQLFTKLAAGTVDDLVWQPGHLFEGQQPGTGHAGIAYWPHGLTSLALYALIVNDDNLGSKTAAAVTHYYQRLEPEIDRLNNLPSVYRASWQSMDRLVGGVDFAMAYDFSAKWMTDQQKALMRRVIAKAIGGRRGYGQDGSIRMRDNSRVTEQLSIFLANLAIEGEEGFDAEVHDVGIETAAAFLEWGIDRHGLPYEGNGTSGAGLECQVLSMIALARRDVNLFGHPHFRRLAEAQVQCTSPDRTITALRGAGTGAPLDRAVVGALRVFCPSDKCADYLLGSSEALRAFDPQAYRRQLAETSEPMVLPGPTSAALASSLLYDTDGDGVARAALGLPLDFSDPVRGMFSTRTGNGPDALWVNMQARPDLYLGAGPLHHDAGAFYLQADGVTWGRVDVTPQDASSLSHSLVLIDGRGQDANLGTSPPAVRYLGAALADDGAMATVDLKYAYDWVWTTHIDSWSQPHAARYEWEFETHPDVVKLFKGTQRYRINFDEPPLSNPWYPTLRAAFNPVRYAFRSLGLVRGRHPYAVFVDDVRKDDENHLYQWQMIGGFHAVTLADLGPEELVLSAIAGPNIPAGTPLLLLREVGPAPCELINDQQWQRTIVAAHAVEARFRIVAIPFRMGQTLPATLVDAETGAIDLQWNDQVDRLSFEIGDDLRTRVRIRRNGDEILRSR